MTSLADNIARLRQVLARQNGPTVVAGHSYGGQIITALGTDAPNAVEARSPGADKEANWLPCPPSGPFNVTVRVYQPKRAMLDGRAEANVVVEAGTYETPPINKVS